MSRLQNFSQKKKLTNATTRKKKPSKLTGLAFSLAGHIHYQLRAAKSVKISRNYTK